MASNKNVLGKGLGALLESAKTDITSKPNNLNVFSAIRIPL